VFFSVIITYFQEGKISNEKEIIFILNKNNDFNSLKKERESIKIDKLSEKFILTREINNSYFSLEFRKNYFYPLCIEIARSHGIIADEQFFNSLT
jgi:hypothetical protein